MRATPWLLAGLLAIASAGCQSADLAQKTEKTEARICKQLADAAAALERVAALKPTSTVGEAQAADRSLVAALAALETSEQKLEALRWKTFQTQLKSFRSDVAKVAADKKQTLEQAATELKGKAGPLIAARRELSAAVQCEEGPAGAKP